MSRERRIERARAVTGADSRAGVVRYDFTGREVLVTGASRGIGRAVAEAFLDAGASVTVLADDEALADVAEELSTRYRRRVRALRCDIAERDAVTKALSDIERIDVLVNNAGLERITPLAGADPETEATVRRILEVNVLGTWLVTCHAVPHMPRGASIIITCSIWSRTAVAEFSAYCASKHATLGLVRSFAHELAPSGIRVNGVCPGWVATGAALESLAQIARRANRAEDELLEEIVAAQALPGLQSPADVTPAYLFLASEAAAGMTGQALMADRGEIMA